MRFTIPVDQQARVTKLYHFLRRHLKRNGCGHDTAALTLLRIQGKRVGEVARGIADRIRLSKITRVHGRGEMPIQREIPGTSIVLLHTHKRYDTWPQLIKEHMFTIW